MSHFDSDGALRSVRLARRKREQATGYAGWRSSRDFLGHVMSLLALCLWLLMGAPAVGIAQGVEASGTPGPGGVVEGPGPRYEQRDDGTAVVSVRVEQQSGVEVRVLGRAVNVDVEGLAVPRGNARRPLLTRHFGGPVLRVQLKSRRGAGRIEVRLRAPIEPSLRWTQNPDGSWLLQIVFSG